MKIFNDKIDLTEMGCVISFVIYHSVYYVCTVLTVLITYKPDSNFNNFPNYTHSFLRFD